MKKPKKMSKRHIKYITEKYRLNKNELKAMRKSDAEKYQAYHGYALNQDARITKRKEEKRQAETEAIVEIAVSDLPHFANDFDLNEQQRWIDKHGNNYTYEVIEYLTQNNKRLYEHAKILKIINDMYNNTIYCYEYDENGDYIGDLELIIGSDKYNEIRDRSQKIIMDSNNEIAVLNARETLRMMNVKSIQTSQQFLEKFNTLDEWLIQDIIPTKTKGQFYGPTDTFKSFQIIHMLFCIANGISWYGHDVKKGKIVYLVGEGHRGLAKRIEALEAHYNINNNWDNFLIKTAVQLGDQEEIKELSAFIKLHGGVEMICFDTLSNASTGLSENSNDAWNEVMKILNTHIEPYADVISWIHHSSDNNSEARGAKAKKASIDWEFKIKGKPDAKIKTTQLECRKMKDHVRPDTLLFEMKTINSSLVPIQSIKLSDNEKAVLELYEKADHPTKKEFKEIVDRYCKDTLNSKAYAKQSERIRKSLTDKGKLIF